MAGLNVLNTETGNEEVESTATPLVKPVQAKGKYSVASPAGAVPMNESILENMQRLLEQKQAQQGSFVERLKDARAAFTGYGLENAQSIDMRRKAREEEAADIFQMQNQIAQFKSAQEAQKRFEQRRAKELGLGGVSPVGVGQPEGSAATNLAFEGMDASTRNVLANAKTEEEYNKILNDWVKENAKAQLGYRYNTQLDQIVEFPVGGQLESMTLRQAKTLAERDPKLKALLDKTYPGLTSTPTAAAPVSATPSAAAPVSATPSAAAPVASAPAAATPAAPKPAAPVQAAPVVSSGATVGGGARSASAIKADIELQKEIEASRGKERVKEEESRLATLIDQSKKAVDRADTAARINAIAESDPEMFGPLVKPGVTSAIGSLLKDGIKVGTHGQIALPSIEDIVRKNTKGATPEKLSRAREMEGYLRKVELDFSSAFKGQGAVSENERKIVQAIAGSTSDPADLLSKKAAWMTMSAEKDKALGNAWKSFQDRFGDNVSFSKFERSPEYKQIVQNHEQKLNQQFQKEIQAYGNKPLVTAEEYERGKPSEGKPSSAKGKALVNKYLTK